MTHPDPFAKDKPAGYGTVGGTGGQPAPYGAPAPGTLGQIRGTGITMLLFFVTLGIYGLVYYYKTHEEIKIHTGRGLGGGLALLLAILVGFVSPFLLSDEVGKLHSARGQQPPVTAVTGLWVIPGILILVGPFIWFIKTNGALNDYWKSLGVQG